MDFASFFNALAFRNTPEIDFYLCMTGAVNFATLRISQQISVFFVFSTENNKNDGVRGVEA